ncbi:MAG: phosphomannomutase/phosphoglucomutase [Clostridia bacterium]|nr:phosphomannomutase/phosphoglucomutase [Clostridia bacterium]
MDYKILKSGTDIRGYASELGGNTVQLTNEAVEDIVFAFVVWYINKFNKNPEELRIALGHDSRISAERICAAATRALVNSGVTVLDCGLSSTPAMFMTTVDLNTDAAIEITASHHPFDRNGIKIFLPTGGLEGNEVTEILEMANNGTRVENVPVGTVSKCNYMTDYAARLRSIIVSGVGKGGLPLKGLKIVVDAGNGVGGFYADNVLNPLGADVSGSRYLEPDGMFPNHIPNPEDKTAMQSICEAVTLNNADLGIIFDTDVDRAGCVGPDGVEINRNRLVALASYIAMNGKKGLTVVTDSVTSDGLKTYIEDTLGGKHYRYRRGYKNVIDKAVQLCEQGIECPLAIETSGHAAFRENYFLDDGAYLATKIVVEVAKGTDISKLLSTLKMPADEREFRIGIKADDFKAYGTKVINELESYIGSVSGYKIADDNREGIRVSSKDGWFLLRMSVHDPVMPLNFESDTNTGIDEMIAVLKRFFKKYDLLKLPEDLI